jgi:hypothetical protein
LRTWIGYRSSLIAPCCCCSHSGTLCLCSTENGLSWTSLITNLRERRRIKIKIKIQISITAICPQCFVQASSSYFPAIPRQHPVFDVVSALRSVCISTYASATLYGRLFRRASLLFSDMIGSGVCLIPPALRSFLFSDLHRFDIRRVALVPYRRVCALPWPIPYCSFHWTAVRCCGTGGKVRRPACVYPLRPRAVPLVG